MLEEIYCSACMQHRDSKFFKIWLTNKDKARRCDRCQNDPVINKRLAASQAERKAKAAAKTDTPVQEGLSKTRTAKERCITRDRIADIKAQREQDEFVGD